MQFMKELFCGWDLRKDTPVVRCSASEENLRSKFFGSFVDCNHINSILFFQPFTLPGFFILFMFYHIFVDRFLLGNNAHHLVVRGLSKIVSIIKNLIDLCKNTVQVSTTELIRQPEPMLSKVNIVDLIFCSMLCAGFLSISMASNFLN